MKEQYLIIKRSIRYDGAKHKYIIGPTKRKKVRIVDFGERLTEILKTAKKEQLKGRLQYGELYHCNYYKEVKDKNRTYYEYYNLGVTEEVPADYKELSFVCLRPDGCLELPTTLVQYVGQFPKNWMGLKISIFTSYDIPIPVTCLQTERHRKMCRSCSDIQTSAPR